VRCRRALDFESSLASDFVDRGLVSQLRDKLVGLDVDVLFTRRCFRSFNVTGEEFFSCLSALLFLLFRIVFSLVRMEELVGVRASRDNHGGVGASTEHTLIVHNIVRGVLLSAYMTIRILVLGLGLHYTGSSCKTLRSTLLMLLL
jgi:hypothetical protein